jgi:hypothetical protein
MDKELEDFTEQVRKQAYEMKKAFSVLERAKWIRPTVDELIHEEGHSWESWYAWRPVKDIHGRWHWREEVYRILGNTYMDQEDWRWYYYGTILDVIRTTK